MNRKLAISSIVLASAFAGSAFAESPIYGNDVFTGARSRGVRLEMRFPSTTTGSSTQMAPAFSRSSLIPSDPVVRLPRKIFAEIGIHPP